MLQAVSGAVVLAGALVLAPARSSAAPPDLAGFCSASEQNYCNQYCLSLYPQGALARCTRYSSGSVVCSCQPF